MSRWQTDRYSRFLSGDSELRIQENRTQVYQMINGQLLGNQKSAAGGVSARKYKAGAWGFASAPDISQEGVERVLKSASLNAETLSKRIKHKAARPFAVAKAAGTRSFATSKPRLKSSDLVDYLKALEARIVAKYPDLRSRSLIIQEQEFEKELITDAGARCTSVVARSFVRVRLSMDSSHGPVDVGFALGGKGNLEDTLPSTDAMDAEVDRYYKLLRDKAVGVKPEAGVKDVILHSKLAGILAHEAIGHTVEADLVLGGSVAGDNLGKQVASPLITLVDFAHSVKGELCPLPVYFDDEGVEAEDTVIIENGVLKSFMHSRESAAHFGHRATGHARAWGFNDEPLIRMRNTTILPGEDKIEDMIKNVEDGYYLMDHGNGQADSTSEFMFLVTMGYEIKNGKLGRAILDTTISGVAFDMLKSVTQVSDDLTWVSSGTCGKKQPMHVGMGGPALRARVNLGGQ